MKCVCGHGFFQHGQVHLVVRRMFPDSYPGGRAWCRRRGCGCGYFSTKDKTP